MRTAGGSAGRRGRRRRLGGPRRRLGRCRRLGRPRRRNGARRPWRAWAVLVDRRDDAGLSRGRRLDARRVLRLYARLRNRRPRLRRRPGRRLRRRLRSVRGGRRGRPRLGARRIGLLGRRTRRLGRRGGGMRRRGRRGRNVRSGLSGGRRARSRRRLRRAAGGRRRARGLRGLAMRAFRPLLWLSLSHPYAAGFGRHAESHLGHQKRRRHDASQKSLSPVSHSSPRGRWNPPWSRFRGRKRKVTAKIVLPAPISGRREGFVGAVRHRDKREGPGRVQISCRIFTSGRPSMKAPIFLPRSLKCAEPRCASTAAWSA